MNLENLKREDDCFDSLMIDACRGCGTALGARHHSGCPYEHPWPRDRVDRVQTRIEPVTDPPSSSGSRRTTYAAAIEARAKAIREAPAVYHHDACLDRVEQIRRYCDHLQVEIERDKAAPGGDA